MDSNNNKSNIRKKTEQILDLFMPINREGFDIEKTHLHHLEVSFTISLITIGIIYTIFFLRLGMITSAAIFTFCILIGAGTLFYLRRCGNTYISGNIITGAFFIAFYLPTFLFGGLKSPSLIWLIAVSHLAILMTGKRTGTVWTLLAMTALLSLFLFDMAGIKFKNDLPTDYFNLINTISMITFFIFISLSFYVNELSKLRIIDLHRQANEATAENEQLLSSILAASPVGICIIQGRKITWGNAAMTRILGLAPEEYEGHNTRLIYPSEAEYKRVGKILYKNKQNLKTIETDVKFVRKSGESFDGVISIHPIDSLHPEKGDILALMDITKRKQAEEALRESEEKYRLIMETVPDAITIARMDDNRFKHVNEYFCKLTGYAHEEVLGKTPIELNIFSNEEDFSRINQLIKDSGEINDWEMQYQRKDGSTIDTLFSAKLLHHLNEFLIVTVASDITTRKRAEHEIKMLNRQLEEKILDRTEKLKDAHEEILQKKHKSELADITSGTLHNVKNILTSVKVSADTIGDHLSKGSIKNLKKANDLLKGQMDNIEDFICNNSKGKKLMQYYLKLGESFDQEKDESFKHLKRLNEKVDAIEKIVTAQQGYGGREEVEPVRLENIIEDVLIMQTNSIQAFNLRIEKDYSDNPEVMALKTKLMHIIINLIKNAKEAMQETPSDKRKLTISTEQTETGTYLKISDRGCGISNENLKNIFRHGYTTKKDGHGFGLASCAAYMKEMNGTMNVESEGKGKGATFILTFPFF